MKQIKFNKKIYTSQLIFLICLGIAILFRSFNLSREFSGDESLLMRICNLDFKQILPALMQLDSYPPLTYIMLHQWMEICRSEVWIRLYFVIYGTASCIVIYYLAKKLLGIYIARISFLLAAFSPLLIFVSQYARSYMDSAFWMLLSTLFMLRIIKGRVNLTNWIGYILSSVLSLYTFYFSFLLIVSQFIFVTIFMWREKRFVLKWYLSLLIIAIAVLPWVPSAFEQLLQNAKMRVYNWSIVGVNLEGLRLGLYSRNLFSLLGFDPDFMVFRGGILRHFARPVLAAIIGISFSAFIVFIYLCLKYLRKRLFGDRVLVWFPIFFAFVPVLFAWVCAGLFNMLPNAKYLVAFHGIFLLLIAAFIFSLWEKKRLLCFCFIGLLLGAFIIRIPHLYSVDFDTKGAISFLKDKFDKQDCLVCVYFCPPEGLFANTIPLGDYLALDKTGSKYIIVSRDNTLEEPSQRIARFKKIWFYRFQGNVEVFGANHIADDWLKNMGYKQKTVNAFKNIDVEEYEK